MQHNAQHHTSDTRRKGLVVEDDPADRDLGVSILTRLGFQAEAAACAADALARLDRGPFALVLLSGTLPDMAAPELADKLRGLADPPPSIIVVQPTGEASERARVAAGIIGHVSRPVSCEAIRQLVEPLEGSPGSAVQEPVVDLDHLLSFTDGDLELESELCVLFLSSAEAYFEKMSRSLDAGTPWTSSAHALKGASANLGARRLAALARAAEHQPPAADGLQQIRRAIDELSAFFRERQHTHGKTPGR